MTDDLKAKIFQAIGEASMLWPELPQGEFQSTKAKELGDKLCDEIDIEMQGWRYRTHEEKVKHMRIAVGVCGYGFRREQMDLMVSLYDLVMAKGGEADIDSISRIESEVKERENVKNRSEMLDKVSKTHE